MCQLGFRTNHITDYCVAQVIDCVLTGMDKQKHTDILAAHWKAIDGLEHRFFLYKRKCGFET